MQSKYTAGIGPLGLETPAGDRHKESIELSILLIYLHKILFIFKLFWKYIISISYRSLMGLSNGKVLALLEGGYFIPSLQESAALTLQTLLGDPVPVLLENLGKK